MVVRCREETHISTRLKGMLLEDWCNVSYKLKLVWVLSHPIRHSAQSFLVNARQSSTAFQRRSLSSKKMS